jgi:hypothetical protein
VVRRITSKEELDEIVCVKLFSNKKSSEESKESKESEEEVILELESEEDLE